MSIREKVIRSVCGLCDNGCDVLFHVENERVSKVEGDPESSGYHQDTRNSCQCCGCRPISGGLKEIREEQRARSVRKPGDSPPQPSNPYTRPPAIGGRVQPPGSEYFFYEATLHLISHHIRCPARVGLKLEPSFNFTSQSKTLRVPLSNRFLFCVHLDELQIFLNLLISIIKINLLLAVELPLIIIFFQILLM